MASTVTHTHGNGQADPLAATNPRLSGTSTYAAGIVRPIAAAHAPAARAARHTTRTIGTWVRGPLARAARRSADIVLLIAALAMIAIGAGLAWLPAGFIVAGLGIGYLQIWLATPDQPAPAPPPPSRRIDQE